VDRRPNAASGQTANGRRPNFSPAKRPLRCETCRGPSGGARRERDCLEPQPVYGLTPQRAPARNLSIAARRVSPPCGTCRARTRFQRFSPLQRYVMLTALGASRSPGAPAVRPWLTEGAARCDSAFPAPHPAGGGSLVTPSPSRAREGLLPRRGGAAALARRTLDAGDGGMAPTGRRGASAALQNIPPTLAAKRARRRPACSRGKEGGRLARHPRWQPGRAQPPVAGVSWAPSRFWSPPPPQAPCMPARSCAGGPPAVGSRCSEVWRTTVGGA
jgi:hypothetical protein